MREGGTKGFGDWVSFLAVVVAVVMVEERSMVVEGWIRVGRSSRFETDFPNERREEVFGVVVTRGIGVEDIGC